MNFYIDGHHILNKQNVALFTLLKCKKTGHLYLVVNCHLLFNKNKGDIKFVQVLLIMKGIHKIFELYSKVW
jgi:mRNA deadenylase 3'-5' endonuclease subunit Ccr4